MTAAAAVREAHSGPRLRTAQAAYNAMRACGQSIPPRSPSQPRPAGDPSARRRGNVLMVTLRLNFKWRVSRRQEHGLRAPALKKDVDAARFDPPRKADRLPVSSRCMTSIFRAARQVGDAVVRHTTAASPRTAAHGTEPCTDATSIRRARSTSCQRPVRQAGRCAGTCAVREVCRRLSEPGASGIGRPRGNTGAQHRARPTSWCKPGGIRQPKGLSHPVIDAPWPGRRASGSQPQEGRLIEPGAGMPSRASRLSPIRVRSERPGSAARSARLSAGAHLHLGAGGPRRRPIASTTATRRPSARSDVFRHRETIAPEIRTTRACSARNDAWRWIDRPPRNRVGGNLLAFEHLHRLPPRCSHCASSSEADQAQPSVAARHAQLPVVGSHRAADANGGFHAVLVEGPLPSTRRAAGSRRPVVGAQGRPARDVLGDATISAGRAEPAWRSSEESDSTPVRMARS